LIELILCIAVCDIFGVIAVDGNDCRCFGIHLQRLGKYYVLRIIYEKVIIYNK